MRHTLCHTMDPGADWARLVPAGVGSAKLDRPSSHPGAREK